MISSKYVRTYVCNMYVSQWLTKLWVLILNFGQKGDSFAVRSQFLTRPKNAVEIQSGTILGNLTAPDLYSSRKAMCSSILKILDR